MYWKKTEEIKVNLVTSSATTSNYWQNGKRLYATKNKMDHMNKFKKVFLEIVFES